MNYCTEAVVDIHGVKWYYPEICVDGGVFRAKKTYTNLSYPSGSFRHTVTTPGFNIVTETNDNIITENGTVISTEFVNVVTYDPMPYSGHFYGIRKYTGLAPNLPYIVNVTGRSGSSKAIDIPTEIIEVEYNKNENYGVTNDYSGFKLSGNTYPGGEFGKSVATKGDLLAIGCPKIPVSSGSTVYEEAGKVFLYRRNPRPTTVDWPIDNYKSEWILEKELTLPSGMLGDYSIKTPVFIPELPPEFRGLQTAWFVGQEGRQFGHSVDISINENIRSIGEDKQEIVVVGGVGAKWNRTFDDDIPTPVTLGLMIFTDEFQYQIPAPTPQNPNRVITYHDIVSHIFGKDMVFNYFSDPPVRFDVKLIICVPTANTGENDPIFPDKPDFITLKQINKNIGYPISSQSIENSLSGIRSAFLEAFPYDGVKANSGIPPILGLCFDGSFSMGGRESLEPAIDQFIDFYKTYSFASGLKDFYGVRSSGITYEYVTEDEDANWIDMSKIILNEILDTGRLVRDNEVRFFSDDVGTFNENSKNFNIPPDSGGKVFIFEKESGAWNLIQAINSPNVTREYNDRFGHAVSISDDGEIIVVGSPYIGQAVNVYERKYDVRDNFYKYQLRSWIGAKRPDKYAAQLAAYDAIPFQTLNDHKNLYLALDQEDKFQARLDNNVEEYQNIYTFDYSRMIATGSWTFIANEFAPTSRLGYSVSTNENGNLIVAGAPTDSLNFYNDADVYYAFNNNYKGVPYYSRYGSDNPDVPTGDIDSSWSSSLYTGSAHIFEGRKYYPHNKAVEYGKFGNLHENISNTTADSGHFHYLSDIFIDKNFVKTEFEDAEIPRDAGLVFIITPAIPALSEEVLNNIKNWLSLGDRNLVLVANDPRWEASGIYSRSNAIINDLLSKLNSRMRIVPARNEYESLPSGYVSFNNIVPSLVPQGSTSTYVRRSPTRGSGVADIKIFYQYDDQMSCEEQVLCDAEGDKEPVQIQTRCEMPLKNYGDLRAEWNDFCCKQTPKGLVPVMYKKNWPFVFGSYVPDCDDEEFEPSPIKNQEPIPLLVAAEKVNQEIIYPAIPAVSGIRRVFQTVTLGSENYYDFGAPQSDVADFAYSANSIEGTDYNFIQYNVTNQLNGSLFYIPTDELGGILQARATPKIDITPYLSKEILSDKTYFGIEYSYKHNPSSKINIIPSIAVEAQLKQGSNDENVLFYQNLVSSSSKIFGQSNIAQLNWNGRSSFQDAYPSSFLKSLLEAYNNLELNVSNLDSTHNVAFLPNINGQISDSNLASLIYWMKLGNKRLIITCDETSLSSIQYAQKLCQHLDITLELLTRYDGRYAMAELGYFDVNQNHQIGGNFFSNTFRKRFFNFSVSGPFYPFKINAGAVPLAIMDYPVYDDVPKEYVNNVWDMNAGVVQINVPVIPGSGYRLFIETSSEGESEYQDLSVDVEDASVIPKLPYPDIGSIPIYELNNDRVRVDTTGVRSAVPSISCGEGSLFRDIQVADTDNINIYISCAQPRLTNTKQPKSVRLIGVSGVLIPVNTKAVVNVVDIPVGLEYYRFSDPVEESRQIVEVVRPISTDNTKYCKAGCEFLGNQLIEDGPMVAAQELEVVSTFDAGFERSRITVITDSSILQGRYVAEENGSIPQDTYDFVRSLYPETDFFSFNPGRQFNVYTKIVSPERGSPAKYHLKAPYLGLNKNFSNNPNPPSDPINPYESDYIPKAISRPKLPWEVEYETDPKKIQEMKDFFISGFLNRQVQHSCTARLSGVIDGVSYYDAPIIGGVPQILKDKGYDYLDFDRFPSGYVGDLFGYAVCAKGSKILIGSPMSALNSEVITKWMPNAQLKLGHDGGPGSVYMFEKIVGNKWVPAKKLQPESLMGQLSGVGIYSDHFGHSIAMQSDVILVGAPNHDYGNIYEFIYSSGAFSRKNFNPQFDIPTLDIYDLGYSGIRDQLNVNGSYVQNMGAMYIYENKITDWENKRQSWQLIEKIVSKPVNPSSTAYYSTSGERFGSNIYMSRPYRSDSDYCIIAGCQFASGAILNVGATYAKDIMLRSKRPSVPSSGAWISAKIFGSRNSSNHATVTLNFNNIGDNTRYYASGIVFANYRGEIFLEVSGQDPSTKGFISHRPYIESIYGYYQYGKLADNSLNLHISGGHISPSSQLPLIIDVENSAYVYNTLGLYSDVKSGDAYTDSSGLPLFVQFASGTSFDYIGLYTSGIGSLTDNLNLSVRGK